MFSSTPCSKVQGHKDGRKAPFPFLVLHLCYSSLLLVEVGTGEAFNSLMISVGTHHTETVNYHSSHGEQSRLLRAAGKL